MPLNMQFRQSGKWGTIAAIIINFVLVGLWHGANWTFVVFGLYHGLLYVPLILSGAYAKRHKPRISTFGLPSIQDVAPMLLTFILVSFGNILFRAPSVGQALEYMAHILSSEVPFSVSALQGKKAILESFGLLLLEWFAFYHKAEHALDLMKHISNAIIRSLIYVLLFLFILMFAGNQADFLYAQF
jgi:D-alanyl-lipoteichoic acid acyltransferase DltB (MBOAT superfamily)